MKEEFTLADLKPDPNNPRRHTYRNINMIADSLQRYGANRGIVVDENGVVLAGNGIVEAAASVGIDKVRMVKSDGQRMIVIQVKHLTEEQKQLYAIADNRTADLSRWDADAIRDLMDEGVPLDSFWSKEELDEITEENVFTPTLDPVASWQDVRAEDVVNVGEFYRERFNAEMEGVRTKVCPNCGGTFAVHGGLDGEVVDDEDN